MRSWPRLRTSWIGGAFARRRAAAATAATRAVVVGVVVVVVIVVVVIGFVVGKTRSDAWRNALFSVPMSTNAA